MKFGVISLGCPKNLTDTEVLLGKLASEGHTLTNNEKEADLLLINTCAFIKPAIDEAESEIKKALKLKKRGIIKYIIVAGCLPRRMKFDKDISREWVKEVDAVVDSVDLFDWKTPRIKATPKYYSYLKIADGCDNKCAYCAVPKIRGKFKSRKMTDIVKEAKLLAKSGTKELILVAQDTTYYGRDLYGKFMLPKLLKKLVKIRGIRWIRIMYTHPAHFTDELIKTISQEKKICRYIDLPIQHSCDKILRLMGRRTGRRKIIDLITKIRRSVAGVAIRTSLIVGFPGEKDKDHKEQINFIQKERFERLGIFVFSAESGTPAKKMRGQVPESIKRRRFHEAMRIQNQVSKEINERKIGRLIEVLIENKLDNRTFVGRSQWDAPEIDGSVFISLPSSAVRQANGRKKELNPGEIRKVKINSAHTYDLSGVLET